MIPGAKGQKFDASLLAGARSAKQSGIREKSSGNRIHYMKGRQYEEYIREQYIPYHIR